MTLNNWLVGELKTKYGVRRELGKTWLNDRVLLPLLDGLDEVKPEHQKACAVAINRWLESEERPVAVAVCCRWEEYEKVVRDRWQAASTDEENSNTDLLDLNGAIRLESLTDEQI